MKKQECPICKKEFQVSGKAKRKCCSVKCLAEYYKEALKGDRNPNYRHGPKYCKDCVKKLSRNNKGGYCVRCAKLGERNSFYGRSHTNETRLKMADNHCNCVGENNSFFGKHHTDEFKNEMSNLRKKEWRQNLKLRETRLGSLLKGAQTQLQHKGPTKPEAAVAQWFAAHDVSFEFNAFLYGKFYVDFLLETGAVVEVFGDYWHANPETFPTLNKHQQRQAKKDKSRIAYLSECGHKVIIIWEKEIKNGNFSSLEGVEL